MSGTPEDPEGPSQPPGEVTRLLISWSHGDDHALEALMPLVYAELRRQAARYLAQERPGHTLQPTAVVHEAYLRLVDQRSVSWQNRAHFFGVAAQAMRRLLLDHARARLADKRGGTSIRVPLEAARDAAQPADADVLAVDEALVRLAALDAGQARIVELRYFGGLTLEETAEVLGTSISSVKRSFRSARAFLFRELGGAPA